MKFSLNPKLQKTLDSLITELSIGLKRLDFASNFESFEIEVEVLDQTAQSGDYRISNQLAPNIPSGMIILKQTGNALVTAGDTAWSKDFVYIKNHSTSIDATVKVRFFK